MKEIYIRSILLFPLLLNEQTGGISAALEVDEERENQEDILIVGQEMQYL